MLQNNSKQNNLKEGVRDVVHQEMYRNNFTDLYIVERFNNYKTQDVQEFTCDIKQLNGIQTFKNVPILSQGLGNGRGFLVPPQKDDVVLVTFYGQANAPIILGSIFNSFSKNKDNILDIDENEWVLINKLNGAYIFCNADGEILLKNESGEILLDKDGRLNINDYKFPKNDGNNKQVIKTDGNGNLYWDEDKT